MRHLKLNILEDGKTTGLSARNGAFLSEAAAVCLHHNKHDLIVSFTVEGYIQQEYKLHRLETNELTLSSFGDLEEAVQFGAMGVAIMLINDQTGWKVKRSYKGTGFDYWVGYDDEEFLFQNKLRLEVSGDLEGTDAEVQSRLVQKLKQTEKSDDLGIPALAIIVEFSKPKSLTGSK